MGRHSSSDRPKATAPDPHVVSDDYVQSTSEISSAVRQAGLVSRGSRARRTTGGASSAGSSSGPDDGSAETPDPRLAQALQRLRERCGACEWRAWASHEGPGASSVGEGSDRAVLHPAQLILAPAMLVVLHESGHPSLAHHQGDGFEL